ncbi:hypothetical protein [Epibacterium ulvae]|uniref:hypothetical protein n=1 Tax=Epibacterium ulvae TaxID=1156985 RepID=UPI00249036A0|nr:hypothetical protein [Epibacterium ulvae]
MNYQFGKEEAGAIWVAALCLYASARPEIEPAAEWALFFFTSFAMQFAVLHSFFNSERWGLLKETRRDLGKHGKTAFCRGLFELIAVLLLPFLFMPLIVSSSTVFLAYTMADTFGFSEIEGNALKLISNLFTVLSMTAVFCCFAELFAFACERDEDGYPTWGVMRFYHRFDSIVRMRIGLFIGTFVTVLLVTADAALKVIV